MLLGLIFLSVNAFSNNLHVVAQIDDWEIDLKVNNEELSYTDSRSSINIPVKKCTKFALKKFAERIKKSVASNSPSKTRQKDQNKLVKIQKNGRWKNLKLGTKGFNSVLEIPREVRVMKAQMTYVCKAMAEGRNLRLPNSEDPIDPLDIEQTLEQLYPNQAD